MNNARRKIIQKARGQLEELKGTIEQIKSDLEGPKDEEREAYDNMPESLQSSERGEKTDANATALEEVYDALDELDLDDLVSKLEEACE